MASKFGDTWGYFPTPQFHHTRGGGISGSIQESKGGAEDELLQLENGDPVRWRNSPDFRYKINWDVATDNKGQKMGFGVIV